MVSATASLWGLSLVAQHFPLPFESLQPGSHLLCVLPPRLQQFPTCLCAHRSLSPCHPLQAQGPWPLQHMAHALTFGTSPEVPPVPPLRVGRAGARYWSLGCPFALLILGSYTVGALRQLCGSPGGRTGLGQRVSRLDDPHTVVWGWWPGPPSSW